MALFHPSSARLQLGTLLKNVGVQMPSLLNLAGEGNCC